MQIKVGLDLGASAIKVVFEHNGKLVKKMFLNRIGDDTVEVKDGYKVVTVTDAGKEITSYVGHEEGLPNITAKKVNLKYLEEILLTVAYIVKKECNSGDREVQLDLRALLPVDQYKESKELFANKLKAINIKGVVENETIIVNVIDAKIKAEGLTLLNSCNIADHVTANNLLLLDVGASTADWMFLRKKDNGYMPVKGDSVGAAGTAIMQLITTAVNKQNGGESTYTWGELERDMAYEWKGDVHSVYNYVDAGETVVKKMLNAVSLIANLNQVTVVVTGRAGKLVADTKYFKANVPSYHLLNKDLSTFGNAEGAYKSE